MFRIQSLGAVIVAGHICLAPASASSSAMTDGEAQLLAPGHDYWRAEGLSLDGEATLSWLGLKIYDATLWTESGDFATRGFDQRIALRIEYHRSIPARRLVTTTRNEWKELAHQPGVPDLNRADAWLAEAASIWPDVEPGDFILTIVEPGGASRFYGPKGLLGTIDDPAFGPAFLSIWLHPATSRPELRTALIGGPTGED